MSRAQLQDWDDPLVTLGAGDGFPKTAAVKYRCGSQGIRFQAKQVKFAANVQGAP